MSPCIAQACAESVLLSSPESTPELIQQSTFAPFVAARTAGGLKSLADRARERRNGGVKQQQRNGLAVVVEEEGGRGVQDNTSNAFKPSSSPPRGPRAQRRTSLPALRLPPPPSNLARSFNRGQPPVPMSASLPPSPPESPSVFNWSLPSPGIVSPLSAHSHLTPSTLARAPWTEIVFPRDLAEANSRAASPPYSDEDDGSEEGSCTTPTSITSFGNVHDKDGGGYLGLVIPRIEVLPVPQRRAPIPPKVTVNGKPTLSSVPRMPFAAAPVPARRRSSAPSLEQIKAHVASKPSVVRRSTAPSLTFTAPGSESTTTTTTTSRLPSFLLARRAKKTQEENQPSVVAPSVVVPVFTVTPPPQERGEGGRKVMALLERRSSGGGAPRVTVEPKVWV
ncbi:hypothetical protein BDY24DRAFT_437886 [Mrakia frigida]|uniref:uncharacterized protein n=1 Tax=Mrakia frigida TaxID=29902 RepID=UPI003FCBFFD3